MGNAGSGVEATFLSEFIYHGEQKSSHYGDVSFYHEKFQPSKLYISKNVWTNTSQDSEFFSQFMELRKGVVHPLLAALVFSDKCAEHHALNSFMRHFLCWEYFDNNLEQEIRSKQLSTHSGVSFTEPYIWYFINSAVNVSLALHRQAHFYHGNIQPATLLFERTGRVRLLDNRLLHPALTTYERVLHNKGVFAALSPSLMLQLARRRVNPTYEPSREDSWAVGLTALCATCTKTLDDYYNWNLRTVKLEEIEMDLQSLEGQYSPQLIGFLRNCLQEEESQRLPLEAHEEFLSAFQSAIDIFQLDFTKKGPRVKYDDVVETKIYVETDTKPLQASNELLRADSHYFEEQEMTRHMNHQNVIPQRGDFFEKPEIVNLPPVYNTYVINGSQAPAFF